MMKRFTLKFRYWLLLGIMLLTGSGAMADETALDLPSQAGSLLLDGKTYNVTSDVYITCLAATASDRGTPALRIAENSLVIINIAKGVTLTVKGSDGFQTIPGSAGIYVPSGSKLVIKGEGKLVATGGNAGIGLPGGDGGSPDEDGYYSGHGGYGGSGGGGAAAGIGGNGGYGHVRQTTSDSVRWDAGEQVRGYNGLDAADGEDGCDMGSVYIIGSVTVESHYGSIPTESAASGNVSEIRLYEYSGLWYSKYWLGAGGPGGGGGSGYAAKFGIGGGAPGGQCGATGGSGALLRAEYLPSSIIGNPGAGGHGGVDGSKNNTIQDGIGGAGGNASDNAAKAGSDGKLYASNKVTLTVDGDRTAEKFNEDGKTVTLDGNASDVTMGTESFYMNFYSVPEDITIPTRTGYVFLGYYTAKAGGTQIIDENGKFIAKYYADESFSTLYAHWGKIVTLDANRPSVKIKIADATDGVDAEPAENLLDVDTHNKWCVTDFHKKQDVHVTYHLSVPVQLNEYVLTTGNDNAKWKGRNPKSWHIYGSNTNNGDDWVEVAYVNNDTQMEDKDYVSYNYTASTSDYYTYYKLAISDIQNTTGDNTLALGAWKLIYTSKYSEYDTVDEVFALNERPADVVVPVCGEYVFTGYYTEKTGGIQIFDKDGKYTAETYSDNSHATLYAHWGKIVTLDANNPSVKIEIADATDGVDADPVENLLDVDTHNKWCVTDFYGKKDVHVTYHLSLPVQLNEYVLTTGNDNATWKGRNPKSWHIYGSNTNNGDDWVEVAYVNDDTQMEDEDYVSYNYTASTSDYYTYYKLAISAIQNTTDDNTLALGAWKLIYTLNDDNVDEVFALNERPADVVVPVCGEYVFTGYYTERTGGIQIFDKDGKYTAETYSDNSYTTLYAHWGSTVILNGNGNDKDLTVVFLINEKPEVTVPVRDGYDFLGYYTAETGGTQVFDKDCNFYQDTYDGYHYGSLYAHWGKIVTFDGNGDDVTMRTTSLLMSLNDKQDIVAPRRIGMPFMGYYTEKSGGTQIFDDEGKNILLYDGSYTVLYAHWETVTESSLRLTPADVFQPDYTRNTNTQFYEIFEPTSNESSIFKKGNVYTMTCYDNVKEITGGENLVPDNYLYQWVPYDHSYVTGNVKIYELTILEHGVTLHHFVPAYYHGISGFFDTVNNNFKAVNGTEAQTYFNKNTCSHKYTVEDCSYGKEGSHCYQCDNVINPTYYVYANFDGGDEDIVGQMGSQTMYNGDKLKTNQYINKYHIFQGWNVYDRNGNLKGTFADGAALTINSEFCDTLTFKAQWADAFTYGGDTLRIDVPDNTQSINLVDDDTHHGYGAARDFTAQYVSYTRTVPAKSSWGSLCLPFEIEATDDVYLYTTGYVTTKNSKDYITLTRVSTVPAGTPCMFHTKDTLDHDRTLKFEKYNATMVAEPLTTSGTGSGALEFKGTFETESFKCNNGPSYYGVKNNTFYKVTSSYVLYPFHTCMILPEGVNARTLYYIDDKDEETGIDNVDADLNGDLYDLQGRKVDAVTKSGVYILNGKKVMVK